MSADPLRDFLAAETARPLPPALLAVAAAARARFGPAVQAVLVYGSCLRDGQDLDRLVDLYVLVDDLAEVHPGRLMRFLNDLVPPNVYYLECPFEDRVVRAKVALLALHQLEALVRPETTNPYFWARFAQPTAIAWAVSDAISDRISALLARAVRTALGHALALAPADPVTLWAELFSHTYRTELRAERPTRALELVTADRDRYERITDLADARPMPTAVWRRLEIQGKLWSVARLLKAGFTFQGGADYLVYKIRRHSGVTIELTPFERRHPVLTGLRLFWCYRRRGAFR